MERPGALLSEYRFFHILESVNHLRLHVGDRWLFQWILIVSIPCVVSYLPFQSLVILIRATRFPSHSSFPVLIGSITIKIGTTPDLQEVETSFIVLASPGIDPKDCLLTVRMPNFDDPKYYSLNDPAMYRVVYSFDHASGSLLVLFHTSNMITEQQEHTTRPFVVVLPFPPGCAGVPVYEIQLYDRDAGLVYGCTK